MDEDIPLQGVCGGNIEEWKRKWKLLLRDLGFGVNLPRSCPLTIP